MEPWFGDTTRANNMTPCSPWVSGAGPVFCPTAGSPDDLGFADVVCTLLCVLTPPVISKEKSLIFSMCKLWDTQRGWKC